MFQNNFRWYKIIDTKWLVKIGLHFLKEKNVNLYLLKRQITNLRDLRKWKHLCSSGRIQEWEVSMAFGDCFPSYPLFISPSFTPLLLPILSWIQHGLCEPCNSWGSFIIYYLPAPRNTTAKHDYLQTKTDRRQFGRTGEKKKEGKWWGFRITFTSNQTNQMETMKFYLGPIKQAVIQIKYILHTDNEDAEKEQSLTWPVEGWLALTFLVPFFKYTSSLTQQFHF